MPSATWAPVLHGLGKAELAALARGKVAAAVVGTLTAAESSKHRLLVEAVRRRASDRPHSDRILLDAAVQLLIDVEAHSPDVVANLIALPQIGGWAVDCMRRMAADEDGENTVTRVPLSSDLGYLGGVAATAALRTSHPFDLSVPLRDGMLLLPGLGMVDLGSADPRATARIRLDANGAAALSRDRVVPLPVGMDPGSGRFGARWSPVPRLRAEASGMVLDVVLDALDPFLARVGAPAAALSATDLATWQRSVGSAWRILVRHHRASAEALSAAVSTLVPLTVPESLDPRSATSGWTFGAIGLSLPHDAVSLAQMLVHEFQHLVLGAVEDLEPLVVGDRDRQLGYAPWRNDPRPAAGLLHGCYAYLGVTAFWRRQRRIGSSAERFRAAAEFARWRLATLDAARRIARSPALTETGRRFATGIRDQLTCWLADQVPVEAERLADEVRTEHLVRWRLNNLRPATAQIEALAQAWLSDTPPALEMINSTSALSPASPGLGQARARLLEARYLDPDRIRPLIEDGDSTAYPTGLTRGVDESELALLRGDDVTAKSGYLRRLETAADSDAWCGLAVVWSHSGSPECASLLAERPEVVAAVHARLRSLRGQPPDVTELVEWLAGHLAIRAPASTEGHWLA